MRRSAGSALILVLVAVVILGGLMAAGFGIVTNSVTATKIELELRGQTLAVAESGITEALSWFRRSSRQPVQEFSARQYDAVPVPKTIPRGIVREFEVSRAANLWGRYEVLPEGVSDVTADRGRGDKGNGTVWKIRSTGYVYIRHDPTVPYDKEPNRIAHRITVETELQRLAIRPPARAALLVDRGDAITVGRGGRIRGNTGGAITWRQGTGRPAADARAEISSDSGAPMSQASAKSYDLSEIEIFGVRPSELSTLADLVVPDTSSLTHGLPQLGITYIDGNAVFDGKHPLQGGGVLYVNGDLTVTRDASASFFGQIYVAGNLTLEAPSQLSGCVIVRGKADVRGTGDIAEIAYNEDILNVVRQKLGQYRIRRTLTRVFDAPAS